MRSSALRKAHDIEAFDEELPLQAPVPAAAVKAPQDLSTGHLCDLPPCIHGIALGAWALLFLVLWITFWSSGNALFMVGVASAYAAVFFGLPAIMARMHPERPRQAGTIGEFASGRFDTIYGPISGLDAILQVVLVPAVISLAAVAIGVIITFARTGP